jgi:ACR3 family arsenite transporter
MYPILCKVRYESLHRVFQSRQIWIQIAFSIFVNWIIAPFLMVSESVTYFTGLGSMCLRRF